MTKSKVQTYSNHRQYVPLVHFFLLPLSLITLILAAIQLFNGENLLLSVIAFALSVISGLSLFASRSAALKVQDRVIRAEEDIRHFKLTGTWIDPRLTIKQLIALRFASDPEFPALCERAVKERLSPEQIKKAIKDWRGDDYRA